MPDGDCKENVEQLVSSLADELRVDIERCSKTACHQAVQHSHCAGIFKFRAKSPEKIVHQKCRLFYHEIFQDLGHRCGCRTEEYSESNREDSCQNQTKGKCTVPPEEKERNCRQKREKEHKIQQI